MGESRRRSSDRLRWLADPSQSGSEPSVEAEPACSSAGSGHSASRRGHRADSESRSRQIGRPALGRSESAPSKTHANPARNG
jgi:hypothetical protein